MINSIQNEKQQHKNIGDPWFINHLRIIKPNIKQNNKLNSSNLKARRITIEDDGSNFVEINNTNLNMIEVEYFMHVTEP